VHYIGSKERLIPFLRTQMQQHVREPFETLHFCDLFAGSGSVGRAFHHDMGRITSNDLEYFSYILNHAYLKTATLDGYQAELDTLNNLAPKEGLIFFNYALGGGSDRRYFSDANAMQIDAVRMTLSEWLHEGGISRERYYLLLSTLLVAAVQVANTTSVFSAYLKELKFTARQPLTLLPLAIEPSHMEHDVFNDDANTLIQNIQGDILYLDPPYNLRQYGANYHLLNTIARYEAFEPRGKTGLPLYHSSPYSRRKDALEALKQLLEQARFRYIFLSYSDDGIIANDTIAAVMEKMGSYHRSSTLHKRFNSKNATSKSFKTREYLHILKKQPYM